MAMEVNEAGSEIGFFASEIGKGLLAGLAGTAAMTLVQMLEMKLEDREPGEAPATVAEKVLKVKPVAGSKGSFIEKIHWAYGTSWGAFRGALAALGIQGWKATLIHFGAVWGTAIMMLPKYKAAPPVKKWTAKQIAVDAFMHAAYVMAAGLFFEWITRKNNQKHGIANR